MKIRNGFVSNSSSSSFILMYIPEDFDFDTHMEYMLDKYKGKKQYEYYISDIKGAKKDDVERFIKSKGRNGDRNGFMEMFLTDFIIYHTTIDFEGYDTIKVVDKKFLQDINKMEGKTRDINIMYKDKAIERKEKREIIKDKTKHIDPYGEEDWDDIDESYKIKRLKI